MNEQVKRLADDILIFATDDIKKLLFPALSKSSGLKLTADDIKAALKLAIKQVNQIQHAVKQHAAAAERAASEPAPDTLDEAQAMSLRQAREAAAVNAQIATFFRGDAERLENLITKPNNTLYEREEAEAVNGDC